MPANQLRSQLSPAYWTTSRNGGEVTTSCTDASAIVGVFSAGPAVNSAGGCDAIGPSLNKEADFLRISFFTSRSGGTCPRFSLILRCACTDAAWFGGSV